MRFSCDTTAQIDAIINAAALLEQRGIRHYRLFVYLLVTSDIDNAAYRVERLKELTNISIYAQGERNEQQGIRPNRVQNEFCHRYIYGNSFRRETWPEYCKLRNFKY